MCGRMVLNSDTGWLLKEFRAGLLEPLEWSPRFNVAPTQLYPVIVEDEPGVRSLRMMSWGLVPSWAKDRSMASRMINARSETAHEKPSFRDALQRRRCLVPASGFYEWKVEGRNKIPHYIQDTSRDLFAMAGLWESWNARDEQGRLTGEILQTFTILTTEANPFMAALHDRMPRILSRPEENLWLSSGTPHSEILKLLKTPATAPSLASHRVSRKVNSPAHEGPELLVESKPRQASLFGILPFLLLAGAATGCVTQMTRPCSDGGDVSWRSSRSKDGELKGDKHCLQKKNEAGKFVNHGSYKVKSAQGKTLLDGRFEEGRKEGYWYEYDEKGNKIAERYFEAGVEKSPPASSAERKSP